MNAMMTTTVTTATNWVRDNTADFMHAVTFVYDKNICYPWQEGHSMILTNHMMKVWINVAYIMWCAALIFMIKPKNIYDVMSDFLRLVTCGYIMYTVYHFVILEGMF